MKLAVALFPLASAPGEGSHGAPWSLFALPLAPSAIAQTSPPVPRPSFSCPPDMVAIEGTHYENVERVCLRFTGQQCFGFWPYATALEGGSRPVRACMDRHEWPNQKGAIPEVMMRFTEAEQSCRGVGKRLCSEYEWETACEGSEVRPFPYGFDQEKDACNVDKAYRPYSQAKLSSGDKAVRDRETARLFQGAPSGAHPKCVSQAGVVDLVGNVEEWVTTSRPQWPWPSSLKGGYWSKAWAGCRGTNDSHGPLFRFYEIGFRCCSDPRATNATEDDAAG